jgi:4-methyl-5(b-hydroxyethyl)-thiazole monophosphate biosynthesis
VPIADGSEEIETCCITDTLVRAGAEVTVASVEATTTCTMSRGLKIVADALVTDLGNDEFDLVALPGGMPGAERLRDSDALDAILRKHDARRAPLAAVCASPAVILKSKGLIDGRQATCYPAPPFVEALGDVSDGAVVRDGHITTSRGPGTSLKFALDLVDQLYGPEKAEELRAQMLVD